MVLFVYMKKSVKPVELLSAAVLLIVCCGGKVYAVTPFGTPMFCALSGAFFIGFVAPVYLLCAFLFTFEVWRLYTAGAVIFIMAVRWFAGLKLPRCDRYVAKTLFSITAIVTETALSGLFMHITTAVITGVISVMFYYFAAKAAECARTRFARKFDPTEAAAMCVTLIVAGLAFGRAQADVFLIGLAPATLLVLLLAVMNVKFALCGGAAVALGLGLNADVALAPAFMAFVLTAVAFSRLPRVVYAVTAIGVYAAVAVLFFTEPIIIGWNALMMTAGALPFFILPRRAVRKVGAYFDFDGSARLAVRHYINRTKADAGNRMLAVSSVFDETARLMNAFSAPVPDYCAVGAALADRVCPYCQKYGDCDREKATAAFTALAERAHAGRAILSDLPQFFTESCARTVDVINAADAVTDGARERERGQSQSHSDRETYRHKRRARRIGQKSGFARRIRRHCGGQDSRGA